MCLLCDSGITLRCQMKSFGQNVKKAISGGAPHRRKIVFVVLSLLFLGTALFGEAQSPDGTITGTVADNTGAVIASASITAKNVDTGLSYRTSSALDGTYVVPSLSPG